MNKTGLDAFDTYKRMLEISHAYNGATPKDMVTDELWRKFDILEAASLKDIGSYLTPSVDPGIGREEFYELFYTDKQKSALASLREGHMTLQELADYLEIELPEVLYDRKDEDIAERISTAYYAKKDDIFLCTLRKYVLPDRIKHQQPMCIIGYKAYQEDFAETGIPFITCSSLSSYTLDLSEAWRSRFSAKGVTISGSIGKTTTTEMIGLVAGQNTNMYKITGNKNTTWQITDFVYNLRPDNEVYVQECSGSYLSQLEASSRVIHPDIFVLTNIGQGHIGKYDGLQELLLYEKISMDRQASPDAVGIINKDDALLKKVNFLHNTVTYGIEDPSADFFANSINEHDGTITFDLVEAGYGSTRVVLNVLGRHNVYNALAAFATGVMLGIDRDKIVKSLAAFSTEGLRQNLTWLAGRHLYLDCYSATVESMETGMKALENISVPEGGRKIACLGDIPALEDTETGHRTVGRMTAAVNTADETIFYGEDMKYAYEEAVKLGVCCKLFTDRIELENYLLETTTYDDLIMFKASHKVAFQWVIDDLVGTNYYPHDELTNAAPILNDGKYTYRGIDDYGACLTKGDKNEKTAIVPTHCDSYPIRHIDFEAWSSSRLREIVLQAPLIGVSNKAFENSKDLKSVSFPDTLRYIGPDAFSGCSSLAAVDLSRGCETIDDRAFSGCTSLREVSLPETLRTIRDNAFDEDTRAVFRCPEGSIAEAWVKDHGFRLAE